MHVVDFGGSWFALQVRYGSEKVVAMILRQKGYSEFLPLYQVRRRWSDRIKELAVPLFQGYIFCRFDCSIGAPIVTTPGVIRIVGAGKTPVSVSDQEIETLQALMRSGLNAQPCGFVRTGQRVTIKGGPLCGLEGIVLRVKNNYRLVVSVSLLQRSVAVEIDSDWLRPSSKIASPFTTSLHNAHAVASGEIP